MNTRAFSLALIISVMAMFMVYTYVEDQKNSLIKKYGRESSVVIAKADINEFDLIDDSKVTTMTVPEKFRPPGHFKTIKEVENTIATVPILKDEIITKPRVTYPGAQTGLSRQVSVGKRAISVLANDDNSVGKLIKPGDRVDIIAKMDYAGGRMDIRKVKTILQDVLVLSTGMNITNTLPLVGIESQKEITKMKLNTYTRYGTITLELDPFQTQKLVFLLRNLDATPYFVLRNNNDKKILRLPATKIFDILGDDAGDARNFFNEKYAPAKK